jgi:hypothetical protein
MLRMVWGPEEKRETFVVSYLTGYEGTVNGFGIRQNSFLQWAFTTTDFG